MQGVKTQSNGYEFGHAATFEVATRTITDNSAAVCVSRLAHFSNRLSGAVVEQQICYSLTRRPFCLGDALPVKIVDSNGLN